MKAGFTQRILGFLLGVYLLLPTLAAAQRAPLTYSGNIRESTGSKLPAILLLVGIAMAFVAAYFYFAPRWLRAAPRIKGMRLLSEEEEDAYLTEQQQYEEALGGVDYHVYLSLIHI